MKSHLSLLLLIPLFSYHINSKSYLLKNFEFDFDSTAISTSLSQIEASPSFQSLDNHLDLSAESNPSKFAQEKPFLQQITKLDWLATLFAGKLKNNRLTLRTIRSAENVFAPKLVKSIHTIFNSIIDLMNDSEIAASLNEKHGFRWNSHSKNSIISSKNTIGRIETDFSNLKVKQKDLMVAKIAVEKEINDAETQIKFYFKVLDQFADNNDAYDEFTEIKQYTRQRKRLSESLDQKSKIEDTLLKVNQQLAKENLTSLFDILVEFLIVYESVLKAVVPTEISSFKVFVGKVWRKETERAEYIDELTKTTGKIEEIMMRLTFIFINKQTESEGAMVRLDSDEEALNEKLRRLKRQEKELKRSLSEVDREAKLATYRLIKAFKQYKMLLLIESNEIEPRLKHRLHRYVDDFMKVFSDIIDYKRTKLMIKEATRFVESAVNLSVLIESKREGLVELLEQNETLMKEEKALVIDYKIKKYLLMLVNLDILEESLEPEVERTKLNKWYSSVSVVLIVVLIVTVGLLISKRRLFDGLEKEN